MNSVRVMAFGSFSIIHPGHVYYLEEARKLGDYLIAVLATDRNIEKEKGKKPHISEQERLAVVAALKPVDEAVLGDDADFYRVVKEKKPDVIALGYDSRYSERELEKKLADRGIHARVVRIKKFEEHSTSGIIRKIKG